MKRKLLAAMSRTLVQNAMACMSEEQLSALISKAASGSRTGKAALVAALVAATAPATLATPAAVVTPPVVVTRVAVTTVPGSSSEGQECRPPPAEGKAVFVAPSASDRLPCGWKVELRTRQRGKSAGAVNRYFWEPGECGRMFRSLRTAQQAAAGSGMKP